MVKKSHHCVAVLTKQQGCGRFQVAVGNLTGADIWTLFEEQIVG